MSQVFGVLFPVFSIILVGYLYGRWRPSDINTVNRMNIDVFIPALVIDSLMRSQFDLWSYRWLLLAGIGVVIFSGLVAWTIAYWRKLSFPVFVPTMMFNNCGNMGLPIAVLAFGESALPAAMILFLCSNCLHFTLGTRLVGGKISWLQLLLMPINLATIIGITLNHLAFQLPVAIALPVEMLAEVSIPLMLFTLGIRMIDVNLDAWSIGLLGSIIRPLSGLLAAMFLIWLIPLELIQQQQLLLFAILPPAVLNYMVAERFNQDPVSVASMVIVGNATSIITLFAMLYYLKL